MSDTLYSQREEQNNKKFDELASTLNRFRTTIDQDIHGQVQQENSLLDSLGDNFNSMMILVKKTSGDLRTVMNRNASLTRIVGLILLAFFVIWMLYKLY
ncbi:Protein transport protein SFT1 [Candida viswanathii]|uniref:Protein transport protein SFT1 n=1 Tax=Candida viswanathii TaxID=5486 RepID=A0A367YA09_9ASCO|nr:Protein transport protein SFT1 [Candida viswanathii]RCK66153.1 Protein transport protein SFT1 [Candida viswanathii]